MKVFEKYERKGAYHWVMLSRNLKHHSPVLVARYQICLELLGDVHGCRVLDLGCGDGALAGLIAQRGGQVVGIDPNKLGIELAKQEFAKHGLNGEFLLNTGEIADNSFELLVCTEVIEHVDDPDALLTEIRRVLKADGVAVISTPIRLTETPIDNEHVQEFFPSEFSALCDCHFEVVEIRHAIPVAAQEIYYQYGFGGRLLHMVLSARSAWFNDNYLLKWKGNQRFFTLQFARLQKKQL